MVSGPSCFSRGHHKPAAVRSLVALAHVASVTASIAFYAHLGFQVRHAHTMPGSAEPVWAWLTSGDAQLMVTAANGPIDSAQQAILFYGYCVDVSAMRAELIEAGVDAGPITYPFYSPRGEFRLEDPDGYVVIVAHA